MNKENLKNVIRIFSYCQTYIPDSRRLNFSDVKQLFNHLITETEFESLLF